MTSADLFYLGLVEVGERIHRGELSSVDVTRTLLARIEQLDPRLKSFAIVSMDDALAAAAAADREIARHEIRGPLHGVPVAVKDLCDVAGLSTMAGMPIRANAMATTDATVVARLRSAGAVLLGKLQMTEGAYGSHHPAITPPLNPWNPALWIGASSSGSGAATAAGLCYGSIGTDTLGSIRFPSTMNGLTGLKPTWGLVSRAGVFPLSESLDHVGPMTRSAVDAAAMLTAIAGRDPRDPTSIQSKTPDYLNGLDAGVRGLRIGVDRTMLHADAEPDMVRITEDAAATFAGFGARVSEVRFPSPDQIVRDAIQLCAAEAALVHAATFPAREAEYGDALAGLLRLGATIDAATLSEIRTRRDAYRAAVSDLFRDIDLLLMPAMNLSAPTAAWLAERAADMKVRFARIRFTVPFDMTGSPSLTLPGGVTGEGMPLGFQIIGRHLDEALVLRAGVAYQQATDWHQRHPAISA